MTDRAPSRTDRLLIWSIVAAQFAPPFMFSGVAVALPGLGSELAVGAAGLGLIETVFLAASLSFLLPFGRLAEAFDGRLLFLGGMIAFGLLSLAIGASSWLPGILLLRGCQGLASAAFTAVSAAIIADLVPASRRGRVFGASMGVVYAGLSLGPLVAGWLVHASGWRAVFVVGGLLVLLGAAVVSLRLRPSWRRRAPATSVLHLPSVALLAGAVAAVVGGCAYLQRGWPAWAAVGAGLAAMLAFFAVQARIRRPLLDLRLLAASPPLAHALLAQLLLYLNAFCSMFLMSLFLQVALGCSARQAGLVLASGSLLMAVIAPGAGMLADRFGPRPVVAAGIAAVLASSLVGALALSAHAGPWHAAAVLLLQGLGFGLFSSPNMATIMSAADPSAAGMASALAAKARSVGMVAGMLLTGALLALQFGEAPPSAHPERLVTTTTTVYAVLACTATAALWSVRRRTVPVAS